SGLGGVGKTQTALEYAYRYEEDYSFIFWVKAHTSESLSADYVSIAALLNLPEKDAQDQSLAIAAVKRWLDNHNDWLLIIDNADDLAIVKPFLPLRKTGDVLLTTRAHNSKPIAAMQSIEKMEVREGALFLLSRLGEIEMGGSLESASTELRSQAESITKELDGLPLALDQAAAFIEERPSSFGEYLKLYQTARGELLQRRGSLADHDPVTVTFSLAFGKVTEASPAAADLLRVCAFLEADAIPEEIFAKGAGELGESIGSAMTNPLGLGDAIAEACRYSLLQRDPTTETVSLHRLVQVVLKEEMDDATRRIWAERAVRAVNAAFPYIEFANWQACSRLVPHVLQLVGTINQYDFTFEESARLLNQTGSYLLERAQYAEAEPLMRRALAIDEASFGKDHPDVARDLNNLAGLLQATNRLAEAEPLMRR
ncbi:MAG: tetratricopeptide repeat protein, partial [Acidobacteria bacterium]|nr:tetratricopeptide repeat protein [Acidobacteriota bacterium]